MGKRDTRSRISNSATDPRDDYRAYLLFPSSVVCSVLRMATRGAAWRGLLGSRYAHRDFSIYQILCETGVFTAHNLHTVISDRAYGLWESEGCPDGHALEHWLRAEREILLESNDDPRADLTDSRDKEGIRAARRYELSAEKFEESGKADAKAQEAERAIEGPEAQNLKKAEQIGKSRGKGEDQAGNR